MSEEKQNQQAQPKPARNPRVGRGDVLALKTAAQSYRLEHVVLSPGHDYRIENALHEQIYFVDGKLLSPVRRLSLQDTQGRELALIRDKFLAVRSRFEVVRDRQVVAKIRQRLWNIAWEQHTVQLADGIELETRRDDEHGECLCRGDVPVVHFKPVPGARGAFNVIIRANEDQLLMLAVVIAMIEFKRLSEASPNP